MMKTHCCKIHYFSLQLEKIRQPKKKYIKYQNLHLGADVNAVDANNKLNTPLHVAVMKGEAKLVSFLLERGANTNLKNKNNQTALDIAEQLETFISTEIGDILKKHKNESQTCVQNKIGDQSNTEKNTKERNNLLIQNRITEHASKALNEHYYQKRTGTSGLGGQLYETKLLTLVLLRALYSDSIDSFILGTNVEGIGVFDDIIFRYTDKGTKKSTIIFLQAKHRENPIKDEVTVEEVLKQNGDFTLDKYLESYLKITQKFSVNNKDNLFKGSLKDVDSVLILFTSARENFTKKKTTIQNRAANFIKTNEYGKIFQFAYDDGDINYLVQTICKSRAVTLAKRLCQFILKDNNNYKNMMLDDLIKSYHVFLAQNVITLEATTQNMSKDTFYVGKFKDTFLASNEDLLLLMNRTIYKEIEDTMKSSERSKEVNMQVLTFKLPVNFGNVNFCFSGSDAKKQRRLQYLCSKFQSLVQNVSESDSKFVLIKVDDNMVGPNKVLQDTDLEIYRLGGLVGNLLIFDEKSNFLMFNFYNQNLSEDNVKLLELLKEKLGDLSCYRFDFKISRFPKLTLIDRESDIKIANEFLCSLIFYTNQAKEDEVENIIKKEIDTFCNIKHTQNESLFRITCDAIFLKVHDKIQKWWKRSVRAPYLTAACNFFYEAQREILDSPLLSFLNITQRENMKNILVKFVSVTIDSLEIEKFLKRDEKTLVIFSNEINFSCIKLMQYFDDKDFDQSCLFIDFDFVIIENYFEVIQSELRKSKVEVLIIVFENGASMLKIYEKINVVSENFRGKIIIVTNNNLRDNFETLLSENIIQKIDSKNSLNDLASECLEMILTERKVLFQGDELPLDYILDSESLHFVKANVLRKIINKETIKIGKKLVNPSYETIANFYINQSMCRYITIDSEIEKKVIDKLKYDYIREPQGSTDIILVTELETEYQNLCKKYEDYNVHWFSCDDNNYVWKNTRGSVETLLQYVSRGNHNDNIVRPKTLKDIREKNVIISAEPGMGKSTLLTHLAIQTKRVYPKLWIAKINLLDYIDQFSKWKENETNVNNILEAIKFLYLAVNTNFKKENEVALHSMKQDFQKFLNDISIDEENNIHLTNNEARMELCELGLLEINLFSHYYNKKLVALLFDGFDEICPDYTNEVLKLLSTLKTSKIAHLWVTTRSYHVLNQLECVLGTFAFSLQALTPVEQEVFLERIWSSKLGLDDAVKTRNGVKKFFNAFTIALGDEDRTFTSLPLHLNMVSEIFLDFIRSYFQQNDEKYPDEYMEVVMKFFNLNFLYETFVDMKFFKIRFGEKKHFMCFKDPDMRKIVEKERKSFLDNHKKICAYFLLDKSIVRDWMVDWFTEQEIEIVHEFIKHIKSGEEKSDIIERVVGVTPKFVHITFGEYFAVEFLFDKFKSDWCSDELLLTTPYIITDNGLPRFISSKLIRDKKIFFSSNNKSMCDIIHTLQLRYYSLELVNHISKYILICASMALTRKTANIFIQLFGKKCDNDCRLCEAKDKQLYWIFTMLRHMGSTLRW